VQFRDVAGALSIRGGNPTGFEWCSANLGSCRWAEARVQGSSVVLLNAVSAGSATRVRYAWGESPVYSLRDDSGLPAGPFEVMVR
jgi:sialate O-acetylesterase